MKYPIGLSIILNALAAISILSGCSDYLDREYDSFIDNEMTFTSYERTSKFLVNAYRYLPDGFNRIGSEAMLDAATDDAEHANASCNIQYFNTGAWNSRSNPDDLWNKYYAGIRIANEFIENVDRVNLDKYRLDPDNQNEYQNRLNDLKTWKYEARFLRAFFHFELVKRFGPVPVITSTLSVNADYSETPRPSMDDCISFISSECDKVAEVLDLTPGRGIDSDLGRATKGAALALKSRVLLYAASPLYLDWQNFSESDLPSDMEKWKAAAQAAKDVIDLGIYSLYGSYATLFKNNFQNSEFILMRRYGNSSDFEKYNFPVSYGGVGEGVSQLSSKIIVPLLNMFLGLSITSSVSPSVNLSGFMSMISKSVKWLLGFSMTIFTAVLTFRQLISVSVDNVSTRAVRFTLNSFIPIVGSALSDAYKVVQGSIGLLKSGIGIIVILSVTIVFMPVILQGVMWMFTLWIGKSTAEVLNLNGPAKLLENISSVFSTLIAVLLCIMSIYILSTAAVIMLGGGSS